jgi:hypothetical protein
VEFIRANFAKQTGDKEVIKMCLLDILADSKTAYSYKALKELLLQHTPLQKGSYVLSYNLTDSLWLTASLFPEVLTLSNNHLFAERITDISNELLDSNLIPLSMMLPYRDNFYHSADTLVAALKSKVVNEDYYSYSYVSLLDLLRKFNEEKGNRILQKYLLLNDPLLKKEAAIALAKNKQVVPGLVWDKIAADKEFRRELYDSLQRIGAIQLFPKKYLTQKLLAESDMYNNSDDDDDSPSSIALISERVITYKGARKKFYLYKVTFSYEDEDGEEKATHYLGIAGPYAISPSDMKTNNEASGLFYGEEYDLKKVDKQFAEYIKTLLEPVDD